MQKNKLLLAAIVLALVAAADFFANSFKLSIPSLPEQTVLILAVVALALLAFFAKKASDLWQSI
ncbi:hypothetical protein HY993_00535 [Candidatus Micrarchaeota archaeon]|nr:hypothetical protein [Candidatus Micrarchaeota archaeon]